MSIPTLLHPEGGIKTFGWESGAVLFCREQKIKIGKYIEIMAF